MKRNAVRLTLLLFFVFSFYTQSFAKKLVMGLYDGDATSVTQFKTTQTVASWAADTTAKELVHVKVGVKSDAAAGDVTIYSFTLTIIFDKEYFEVTDASGTKITSLTGLTPYFPFGIGTPCTEIQNTIDYVTGTISYAAWWPATGFCYYDAGLTPLKATTTVPAMLAEFYLKPLKGSNGVEKTLKLDTDNDNTSVDDSNGVTYKKSDSNFLLDREANHNANTGYKFKLRPVPPSLAALTATNTKVTLAWTSNDTTGAKYYVYRAKTTASGAAEPTSFSQISPSAGITTLTYDNSPTPPPALWDSQYTKYWYKVTVKDSAATPVESCDSTKSFKECVTQSVVDTTDPAIQSYDVSSTVFDQIKIAATLDEPGFVKAMYSCQACQTPVTDKETAYQPSSGTATNKPTVALSSSGAIPTTDFVAADEGKTVTYKIKAKDAAGHELAFSAEKTFAITTCTETAPPTLSAPTAAVSCPSSVKVSWDTGAKEGDSTIYFSKSQSSVADAQGGFKKAFENGDANVYTCNDAALVKPLHELTVPSCGATNPAGTTLSALESGITYYYQVCSKSCFTTPNCTVSTYTFPLNAPLNVTHTCSSTSGTEGQAYLLSETVTGGCSPKASIKYAPNAATLSSAPSEASMTQSGTTFSGSVPSGDVVAPSFMYYILTTDDAGSSVTQPASGSCTVPVGGTSTCGTPVASCNDMPSGVVNQAASVSLDINTGTAPYSCDLYFGTSQTSVTEKLSTKTGLSNGAYTETIPASKLTSAGNYFFQSKCTDSCAEGAKSAESAVCNITVNDVATDMGFVKGIVKASDTTLPVESATVKLINPSTSKAVTSNITTQANGAFEFSQIPVKSGSPAYRVEATAAGYGTTLVGVSSVTKNTATDVGDVMLVKTTKISGACTDSKTGSGIANLKVTVKNGSTGISSDKNTDSTGNFSVEGLSSGTYSVNVDVTGTKYKKPDTQNITVPPDGTANFLLEPSPIVSVVIASDLKSIGYNQQTAFRVDKVITSSGASLPKTPVEWDVSSLSSLGEVSYSDGSKTILIFKSGTKDGTATVSVTKIANEDVPANTVETFTLNITGPLVVKEINTFSPGGDKLVQPLTKDMGVTIQADGLHSSASVTYKIYNLQGKLIKVINGTLNSTTQKLEATWNCTDSSESRVPNGIYIIQAEAHEGGQSAIPGKPKAITCMW